MTPEELTETEDALHKTNTFSELWALVLTGITAAIGLISLATWVFNPAAISTFAWAMAVLPFGILAWHKDKYEFSKWVHEENYSSRGIDMIIWGGLGCICGFAGLMVFVKGVMMLLITQNKKESYPPLSAQQWQARVFQASMTAADKMLLLCTIAGISGFFNLAGLGLFSIGFTIISTFTGLAGYFLYTRVIKPNLLAGNLEPMIAPLIIIGVVTLVLNFGGLLVLVQGILIAIQAGMAREGGKPAAQAEEEDSGSH